MSELLRQHVWHTGELRWEDVRALDELREVANRAANTSFDPAHFEKTQTTDDVQIRFTGDACCCPYDPVLKVEDADLGEGPAYTFDVNDQAEAYVFLTTGAELVTAALPAMADLPRPPAECWQLHLVNLSGSAWRITPPEGVLLGGREYLDLWPGRSIVLWTDQPETGDPTAYYAEEGRYAYDPLAFLDDETLDETSFGRVCTWTASAAKTATIGANALNTGSGQYLANLGTAPLDITPASGTIAGRSTLWLPPRQSLLTTVDTDGNAIALTGRTVIEPRTVTGTSDTITAEDHFRHVAFAGTAACAFAIDATTKRLGFTTLLQNHGSAVATYTAPAATTIDGAAAIILLPRDGVVLTYDGTDTYRTVRGTHPRASREITDDYTVTALDNGWCLVFNISADKTVTVPVFGGGFHVEVANSWQSTGKLTISTTNGAGDVVNGAVLAPRQSMGLFSSGSGYGASRGVHGQPSVTKTSGYTVLVGDFGFHLNFEIATDVTVVVPVFSSGFYVTISNSWNSTGKVSISTTDGGDAVNSATLAPRQSMKLHSNGTGYAAERGVHGRPTKTVSATTYTVLVGDFGYYLNFTASANVAVTVPQFPSGFYFDAINSTADKRVTLTDAAGHTIYVPPKQGLACSMDSTTTLFTQPGQTLSGLVQAPDGADYTSTIDQLNRVVSLKNDDAGVQHSIQLDATTKTGSVFGAFYMSHNESTEFVELLPPPGGTWLGLGGSNPILAAGFGLHVAVDSDGNCTPFAGDYATAIFLCGTGTALTDAFTLNAQSHTALYEGRGADNIVMTMPATFPGGVWWHVNNPSADGFKWFDIFNEDLTQQWRLSADRSTTFVSGGDGTFTQLPGHVSIGAIRYDDDATLTYAHSAYAHWWEIATDKTLTLDASCALPGGGFCIPVSNSDDSEGDLAISVTTTLHGLPGNVLRPCEGGWLFSCDDGDFVFILGKTCCDCHLLTTKGDLRTYDGVLNAEVRFPVGTDGYVLTADSGSSTGLSWQSVASAGGVTSFTDPFYGVWVITAGVAAFTWSAQVKNTFWSGPASGANAVPTFRTVVADDLGAGAAGAGAKVLVDTAPPTWVALSAALDTLLGSTQGTMAYRGASGWAGLAPAAAGTPLVSGGTGGNPSFGTPSSDGAILNSQVFGW